MAETVDWLQHDDLDSHVAVRAAMAHLHVVSIHPFQDGNGRIARITQSLVLAREGRLAPEFSSIEEYLGDHTADYHAALQQVQGGGYQPERDASSWVRFCVTAHIEQAKQRLALIAGAATRWAALERLVESRHWPDRLVIALERSLFDGVERAAYAAGLIFRQRPPVRTSGGFSTRASSRKKGAHEARDSRHRTAPAPSRRTGRLIARVLPRQTDHSGWDRPPTEGVARGCRWRAA